MLAHQHALALGQTLAVEDGARRRRPAEGQQGQGEKQRTAQRRRRRHCERWSEEKREERER